MKTPKNKGFKALPKQVQDIILKRMQMGGGLDRDQDFGSDKKPYPSVKSSDFAGSGRSYPIPTKADAIDALRLAGLHGREDVKAKVYAKYPELKKKEFGGEIPAGYHKMSDGTIMSDEDMMDFAGLQVYAKGGPKNIKDVTPRKVDVIPQDYTPYGQVNGKDVFGKETTLTPATPNKPGTKTDPNEYRNFLIGKLQSGVSPDKLIELGYTTPVAVGSLSSYYKPDLVYKEAAVAEPEIQPYQGTRKGETLLPKSSPDQPWESIRFADLHGQTNKSMDRHFTPDGKEIDMTSYLLSGDLNNSLTGKTLEEYRQANVRSDAQGSTMLPASITNVNPVITNQADKFRTPGSGTGGGFKFGGENTSVQEYLEPYKMGGGNLYKFIGNGYKKLGGSTSPQGESMDDFITNKNVDFVDYIANNTKTAFVKNEITDLQNVFPTLPKAQYGTEVDPQVNLIDPNNPLKPKGQLFPSFGYDLPAQGVPQGVTSGKATFDFSPTIESNTGTPSNLNLDPNYNQQLVQQEEYQKAQDEKARRAQLYGQVADTFMLGAQGINSFFNKYNSIQQDKFNQRKMTIENNVTSTYGSKGDYDINQGNFRPNQKTPPSYKKGGQYSLSDSEIAAMLGQGYLIEFVD